MTIPSVGSKGVGSPVGAAIAPTTRVQPAASVYARGFGAELVLLDFGRGEYFGLDEIGAFVWSRLEAGDAVGAVADGVVARYEVAPDVALGDVMALVTQLLGDGLITVAPAGA